MTKYTTIVKGNITGIVQGDGAQVIIQDGKVLSSHSNRLIKCKACKQLVADVNFCTQCGQPLR